MTSKRKGAKTSSTATTSSSTKTRASAKKCISTSSSSEDLQTSLPTDSGFNSACAQCRKSHKACVGGIPCERCKRLNYECAAVPKKRRGRPPKNSSVGSKRSRKSSNSTTRAPPAKRKKTSSASSAPKRRRPSPVSSPESCNEWSSAEETNDEEEEAIIEPDEEDEDVQQEHLLQLEDDDEEAELDQVTFDEEEVEDLSPPAPPASSETQASPSPTARSPTVAKQELIFPPKTPVAKHDLVEQPIKSNKSSEEPNVVFRRSSPTFSAATPAAANVKLDSHQAAHFSTAKFSPTAPPAVEGKVSMAAATVSSSVLMEVKTCGQNHYQEISSPPSSFVISSPSSFYNHQQQQHQQATTTSCSSSPSRPKSYEAKFSPRVHTTSNYVVTNFVPSQEISPPVSAGIGAASASSSSHRLAAQEAVNHREAGYHYPQHQHPQSQSQQYHPYGHPFVHQHSFHHHRQHQQPQPAGSQSYNQRSSSFFASSSSSPSSASSAGYHSGASSYPSEASTPSSPFVYSRGGAAAIPAGDTSYCQPQSQHYRSFDAEFGSQPSSHQRLPSIRTLFGNSFMDDYHPQRARIVNSSHKE